VPDRADSFLEVLSPELPRPTAEQIAPLDRVRVVLVEPRHPGNVGAVGRAMKVAGLSHLVLVRPCSWQESDEAQMLACGSRDVLDSAVEVETLDEAVAGAATVVGTTHRMGRGRGPLVPPRAFAERLPGMLAEGPVALVFGREDKGLSNEELARCQLGIHIPTAGAYPSLNLSQAVTVIAYECLWSMIGGGKRDRNAPGYRAIAALAERIARLAERTGFRHRRGSVGFQRSLRQAIERSDMTERDLVLVHLVCQQIERHMERLERGLSPDEEEPDTPES